MIVGKDIFEYNFYYLLNDGKKIHYGSVKCVDPHKTNNWRNLNTILKNKYVKEIGIYINETS